MLEVAILIFGVVVSACIGMFVYLRNPRNIVNRVYGISTISIVAYSISNYYSLHGDNRLLFIRIVVSFAAVAVASLYYLIFFSGNEGKKLNGIQTFGVYYTIALALIGMTPLVFQGLEAGPNPSPIPNVGAIFFFCGLIIFPASSIVLLLTRVRRSKGSLRQQSVLMLIGIAPVFFLAPVTAFIMPVVFQNVSLVFLSPIYAAFFVAMIGYAIVRHRLFDIRSYVVRAFAYLFTLLLLSVIYIAPVVYVVANVIMGFPFQPYKFAVGVLVGTVAALYFEGVKAKFDTMTARIFFRDAYDSAAVLGDLNKVLVSTIDLNTLLHKSSELIARSMKSEFCLFLLSEKDDKDRRFIGTISKKIPVADIRKSARYRSALESGPIVADTLPDDWHDLKEILIKNDIAAIVPLSSRVDVRGEVLGYILLGFKKSGNPYNNEDIRTLSSIANASVIAIQNALRFEEIQNFNVTLQRTVDERTAQLRRTNAKLKLLDETKDDFISMASHQLRTPLTSVKGYLSMVLEGDAGTITAMQRKMLDQAFVSSQRMVFLIADLLNVSRLKTGKFVIEPSKVNLATLVDDEVKQLQETAKGRSLELIYHKPEHFPDLMLDETKIRQVAMNFIDNAIYYTPAGGKIEIELVDTPVSVKLLVRDNGIGVPRSEQPHLFTKFYRAGNARRARPDGTGLGLFMARKVVLAQGGSVIFESKEGKGSTFGFVFAKEKLEVPAAEGSKPAIAAKS